MSGICGVEGHEGSVTWKLDQNNQDGVSPTYTLAISGSGAMADYADAGGAPWYKLFPDKGAETAITEIEIGKDVTVVGANAFVWCKAVESVTFAEGSLLEEIHLNGFHSLNKLMAIELPSSLMKIEGAAFYGCSSLQTISFKDPGNLTALGGSAFGACTALKYFNSTAEGEGIIPQNVATIGDKAFQKCTSLTAVTIPAGVETLAATFWGCTNLASVTFSQGSMLKQLLSAGTLGVFAGTALTSIELPDRVETIGDYCFSNADLETVSIPARVQSIGARAFDSCPLASVEFAEGSELEEIGDMAFCSSQQSVEFEGLIIPEGVKKVGNGILKNRKVVGLIRVPSTLGAGFSLGYVPSIGSCVLDASRTDYAIKPESGNRYKLVYVPSVDLKGNYGENQAFAVTNGGIAVGDYADGELMDLERSGYIFDGWYHDADFSGTAVTAPETGKTCYAKWLAEVKFDANGGEGSMDAQRVAEGDKTTQLSVNAFFKTGYTFAGWNTAADGNGRAYAADAVASSVPSGTTLYAQWKANTYTIEFSGGEGAAGSTEPIVATYDKPATLPANGFTKKDMKFEGWDTDSSARKVVYSDATQVENLSANNGATVKLYAVWGTKPTHKLDLSVQNRTYSGFKQAFDVPEGFSISYKQEGEVVDSKDAGSYDVVIHADETAEYAEYNATVYGGLVIEQAPLTVKADDKSMYVGGELPEFTYSVDGLKGSDTLESIGLKAGVSCSADGKATGSFDIVVTAEGNPANYSVKKESGTLTVSNRPVTPPSSDKIEIEHNQDGSTTTTVTKPDGSQTITHETASGTVSVVKKDKDGNITSTEVTVSKKDADNGKVDLPVDAVDPAADADRAPEIEIKVPSSVTSEKPVQVTVPVAKDKDGEVDYGVVAVEVSKDGKETVLPKTAIDKDGNAVFATDGNVTIKVVDNAKGMPDVKDSDWFAGDVVDFATARGIVNGVALPDGSRVFDGYGKTTRGMFVAMLHNLELNPEATSEDSLADVPSDAFYADAAAWALEEGILSGVDMPDGTREFQGEAAVTREQVAVFLMRYAEHLGMDVSKRAEIDFPDAGEVSGFAKEAMSWAVANGLFTGNDAIGELNPTDGAARAEVAAVLMRFINLMYA